MSDLLSSLKAAAKGFANAFGPSRYNAGGAQVRCTHCQAETFHESEALLNTTGATFLKLDWLDKSGVALICENCGLIQWFAKKPVRQASSETD